MAFGIPGEVDPQDRADERYLARVTEWTMRDLTEAEEDLAFDLRNAGSNAKEAAEEILAQAAAQTIQAATAAIVKAARANTNIRVEDLRADLEAGFITGWTSLPEVKACNLSQWSAAMQAAIEQLEQKTA